MPDREEKIACLTGSDDMLIESPRSLWLAGVFACAFAIGADVQQAGPPVHP